MQKKPRNGGSSPANPRPAGAPAISIGMEGEYTSRVTSRRRAYTGPVRTGPRRSKLAFIATIVAIGFVAAAIAYDVGRTLSVCPEST